VKFHPLLLGTFGAAAIAAPAQASELVFWHFDARANQLIVRTNAPVRPRLKIVDDPDRIVLDLPGTRLNGAPLVSQPVESATVREVRAGQFDPRTARLAIELDPRYAFDPSELDLRSTTPTQWVVQLSPGSKAAAAPAPQPAAAPPPVPQPTPPRQPAPIALQAAAPANPPTPPPAVSPARSLARAADEQFQVTSSGLFLLLDGDRAEDISIERSDDGRQVKIAFAGATLPPALRSGSLPVERFGVSHAEFTGNERGSQITLHVAADGPGWKALPRDGSLVLLPEGGAARAQTARTPARSGSAAGPDRGTAAQATIESIDLGAGNRLVVRANRPLADANSTWDAGTRSYRAIVPQARLSPDLRGPQLQRGGDISRIRAWQDGPDAVIQVEVARDVRVETVRPRDRSELALSVRRLRNARTLPPLTPEQLAAYERRDRARAAQQPQQQTSAPRGSVLVTIDPGHGGKDPGAIGIGGLREKDVVLDISQHVRQILEANGLSIQMTRSDDRFISLAGRSQMANRANANLFVSIHANAISMSRPDVNGVETYYYSSGRRLAQEIQSSILQTFDMRDRGVKQANFYVLRNSAMPAVLVEVGFVTGREDAPRLADPAFRRQMAEAIARGILRYVGQNR